MGKRKSKKKDEARAKWKGSRDSPKRNKSDLSVPAFGESVRNANTSLSGSKLSPFWLKEVRD
jgi:hypothetical protein